MIIKAIIIINQLTFGRSIVRLFSQLEADNPVVTRSGRLRTSQIPKALSVSSSVTHPRRHLPALPSKISELRQNLY